MFDSFGLSAADRLRRAHGNRLADSVNAQRPSSPRSGLITGRSGLTKAHAG